MAQATIPETRLRVLYDGACAYCRRAAAHLHRADRDGRLRLVDISDEGFDPEALGLTRAQVMATIHAVEPGGTAHRGLDALTRAYDALGLGGRLRWTRWRPIRPLADRVYRFIAGHRPRDGCGTEACDPSGS